MKQFERFLAPAALTVWALQTATPVIASYFPSYPNHIRLALALATVVLAGLVVVARGEDFRWARLAALCVIPAGYGLSLISASYYGVDFDYSVKHLLLTVPIFAVLEFAGWFLIGATVAFRHAIMAQVLVGSALASHMLWLLASGSENSRLLNGLEFAGAASAGAVSGFWPVSVVLLALTFFSMKKIAIAATVASWFISLVTSMWLHNFRPRAGILLIAAILAAVFAPAGLQLAKEVARHGWFGAKALGSMERTLDRFAQGDPTRDFLDEYSVELLAENFPRGIGYFSFENLSADKINYTTYTADDEKILGVSLHNTYVFFLLEGGALTALIILGSYGLGGVVCWRFAHQSGTRGWAAFLVGWAAACGIYAYSHQLHETPYLFGILGIIFGVWESTKQRSCHVGAVAG